MDTHTTTPVEGNTTLPVNYMETGPMTWVTPPPPLPKNLIKKLAEIQKGVDRIPKRGKNLKQNYTYALASDIIDAARVLLSAQNVILSSTVKSHTIREQKTQSGEINITTMEMEFCFMDGDSGETLRFTLPSEAMDSGDKGIAKCLTMGLKTALLTGLMIPTGEDPDAEPEPAHIVMRTPRPLPPKTNPNDDLTPALQEKLLKDCNEIFKNGSGQIMTSFQEIKDLARTWDIWNIDSPFTIEIAKNLINFLRKE